MKKYVVIVAGGMGNRYGSKIPKQFLDLNGFPMLWWSLYAFHREDPQTIIILVLPEDYIDEWKRIEAILPSNKRIPHRVIKGGDTRTNSVKNGLSLIEDTEDSYVAIHDAARPLVTIELISKGWDTVKKMGNAVPVVPVTDSLRYVDEKGNKAVDRDKYVAIQTPQIFKTSILRRAYDKNSYSFFSDDASAVEEIGEKINLFEGSPYNLKITNPGDLEIASRLFHEKYGIIS